MMSEMRMMVDGSARDDGSGIKRCGCFRHKIVFKSFPGLITVFDKSEALCARIVEFYKMFVAAYYAALLVTIA